MDIYFALSNFAYLNIKPSLFIVWMLALVAVVSRKVCFAWNCFLQSQSCIAKKKVTLLRPKASSPKVLLNQIRE